MSKTNLQEKTDEYGVRYILTQKALTTPDTKAASVLPLASGYFLVLLAHGLENCFTASGNHVGGMSPNGSACYAVMNSSPVHETLDEALEHARDWVSSKSPIDADGVFQWEDVPVEMPTE